MSTFAYPRILHKRRLAPGPFTDYKRFKPALQEEFHRRCVYCRIPDVGRPDTFQIDHYLPKHKFTDLETDYSNLFYACSRCNNLKGRFWSDALCEAKGIFIPQPCSHRMIEHLRYVGMEVRGHGVAGAFAVEKLRLNEPNRLRNRATIEAAARGAGRVLADLARDLDEANKAIGDADDDTRIAKLVANRDELAKLIVLADETLRDLGAL